MTNKSNHFIISTENAIGDMTTRALTRELLKIAQQLGLSFTNFYQFIECGWYITIGISEEADINYIRRAGFIAEQGYRPILDIVEDFEEIKKRLLSYAMGTKYTNELYCGGEVTFHRGFIKIDTEEDSVIIKNEELLQFAAQAVQLNLFNA